MLKQIDFAPGDVVRVFQKIREDEKTRTQVFEGVVLGIKGRGANKSFMVRKQVGDIFVERIWPILSPNLEKVVVKEHPKDRVRHAKMFHLRHVK